jgi:23S rRNA pseudouridine2605 synthase
MRLNKFVAQATGMSRRKADELIQSGRILVDGILPTAGEAISTQNVTYRGKTLILPTEHTTIMLNKPVGYICSRNGQGSRTIYDLLPAEFHSLKPVGRLDKDSSGLLLLTDNGDLAQELTHPSKQKLKQYIMTLNKPLAPLHRQMVSDFGVVLNDGPSKLQLARLKDGDDSTWEVTMHEGRNRQIRRTFASLGYTVKNLHRTHFGPYTLNTLELGRFTQI